MEFDLSERSGEDLSSPLTGLDETAPQKFEVLFFFGFIILLPNITVGALQQFAACKPSQVKGRNIHKLCASIQD